MWSAGCAIFSAEARQYNKGVSLHSQVLVMLVDTSSALVVHFLHYVRMYPKHLIQRVQERCKCSNSTTSHPATVSCPLPPFIVLPLSWYEQILIISNPHLLLIAGLSPCFQLSFPCALLLPTFTVRRTGWPRVDKIQCVIVMDILFLPLIPVLIAGLSP